MPPRDDAARSRSTHDDLAVRREDFDGIAEAAMARMTRLFGFGKQLQTVGTMSNRLGGQCIAQCLDIGAEFPAEAARSRAFRRVRDRICC